MNLKGLTAASALAVVASIASTGTLAAQAQIAARGAVEIAHDEASGKARFVRASRGGDLMPGAADKSAAFLRRHGEMFGATDPRRTLQRIDSRNDLLGGKVETFEQRINGVPVFGARLKTTLSADDRLEAVFGRLVENAQIDTIPQLGASDAQARALAHIAAATPRVDANALTAGDGKLYVYNAARTRGRTGASELVYEVEVTGPQLREFVYVNAHSGKIADQITGTYDAIERRIYEGGFSSANRVWSEGDATPTGVAAWDNLIDYSQDTYNLVSSMTNGAYLSWDGNDGTMHAVNNDPAISCPNAQFTGSYIRFCNGTTTDDVVGHEWFHGYTQQTHGLIYRFQSGALNEAYSDIFGEIVDFLNGDGNDSPNVPRSDGACSIFGGSGAPSLSVLTPQSLAGDYAVGGAVFNPPGAGSASGPLLTTQPADGCSAIATNLGGSIALIDRGTCPFTQKVLNAQARGAVGVVIVNNAGNEIISMGGSAPGISIPSVFLGQGDGATLRGVSGITATLSLGGATDETYRWLTGEDSSAFGGAIRDMWSPNCFGDPGKVSDPQYACDPNELDNGGVHSNSGIINHGFALLVDGGNYNGQSIAPIGLTKAAHLYWRTMSVYQTPMSGYSDHASALAASCEDLLGQPLRTLSTEQEFTEISGDVLTAADCAQVTRVIAALELNSQPGQCGFETLLAQDPPPLCSAGQTPVAALEQDFESGLGTWTTGARAVVNPVTYDVPAWTLSSELPFGRAGQAAFAADPVIGNCSTDIEAGVQYLQSPAFTVPAGGALVFEHSVSTESNYDGGNLKARVNGGGWTLVPPSAFIYNAYTSLLTGSDNPLSGEAAFHGTDGGTFLSSWGRSHVNLAAIASPGDQVELRFEMGTDGCNGVTGWYVDNVLAYECAIAAADTDGDGVTDDVDNCTLVANPDQRDSNGDGYGNACDTDLDNNGVTNTADLGLLKLVFFTDDADADFNGDGVVNATDLGRMRQLFFTAPGPAAGAP